MGSNQAGGGSVPDLELRLGPPSQNKKSCPDLELRLGPSQSNQSLDDDHHLIIPRHIPSNNSPTAPPTSSHFPHQYGHVFPPNFGITWSTQLGSNQHPQVMNQSNGAGSGGSQMLWVPVLPAFPPNYNPYIVAGGSAPPTINDIGGGPGGSEKRCSNCSKNDTPKWRKGPLGPKTLCNACGIRYQKGKKKEGFKKTQTEP